MIRNILVGLCLVMGAAGTALAQPEPFPSRPIKLVLPYQPGGPTDAIARAVAKHMTEALKTPVVVENKPGGQGVIAMQAVLAAKADGYTVGWAPSNALTTNRLLMKNLPYKMQDIRMITTLYRGGMVFAVPRNSPAHSMTEFVELARKEGKPMIYGTAGPGGTSHLTIEYLAQLEGMRTQMVSYRGDGPMALDVLGGSLPGMIGTVATTGEHYKKGDLKILGFTGDKRMEAYPDIPTFKEAGYPQIESYFWAGAIVPAATPEDVVVKLRAALHAAMRGPEVKAVLTPDLTPFLGGEKEYRDFVDVEYKRWMDLIRDRAISLQ
jgi:tripartite-type tricarboxylate transporter receptor subunit TctC